MLTCCSRTNDSVTDICNAYHVFSCIRLMNVIITRLDPGWSGGDFSGSEFVVCVTPAGHARYRVL